MTGATLTQSTGHWHADFRAADLEQLFARCFGRSCNTRLRGGAEEPFYQPACGDTPAQLFYRADYFRSALHEVAHWCVAGPARRNLVDFGYWYEPDGRSPAQQQAFEAVEARPQAFELVFCAAAGHPFSVSLDNLAGVSLDPAPFEQRVLALAQQVVDCPPARMARWTRCLAGYYRGCVKLPDAQTLSECLRPVA